MTDRPNARGAALLKSAGIAPAVAGVLALLAAGLLVSFSVWAQKVVLAVLVEDPGPDVQRLGRYPEGFGDGLEDLCGRLPKTTLDLG